MSDPTPTPLTDAEREVIVTELLGRATADGITTPLLAAGVLVAVERILAARVAAARADALRQAADAALTMYDPPVSECIEWSEWLRARADYGRPDLVVASLLAQPADGGA